MKFTEDLKQAWIKKHSEVDVGMADLHQKNGCFCALGSFLDVLADRGLVEWKLNTYGTYYNAKSLPDSEGYVKTDYEILYDVPLFVEKVHNSDDYTLFDRVYEIYRLNDRIFRKEGPEASRAAVLEYINNLPVEE